jgi:hypothetical protein
MELANEDKEILSKKYNIHDKKNLVSQIEQLSSLEQIEIFKLIKDETKYYTENLNGIFINVNILSDNLLEKIENFVEYCNKQRIELDKKEHFINQQKIEIYGNNNNNEKINNILLESNEKNYEFLNNSK